jgi:inner membrane transporter RhtA
MAALRRMTHAAFGTLMALEPAFGVLIGLLVLHQKPSILQAAASCWSSAPAPAPAPNAVADANATPRPTSRKPCPTHRSNDQCCVPNFKVEIPSET